MPNPLVTFLCWNFIPGYVTKGLQSLYYNITVRAGDPKPQPGSQKYATHFRRIYITLILAYLCFTIYELLHELQRQGDFYQALGVPHDVNDRELRSRFRRLAALHHPDKVSASGTPDNYFVFLKLASDTLLDPVKRYAYDRFGPEALNYTKNASILDHVLTALYSSGPSYAGSALVLIVLGVTGYLQFGRFWRYLSFGSLILLEIYVATRPYPPPILSKVINPALTTFTSCSPLLPFQFLALARKFMFSLFIGVSQIGPMFQGPAALPAVKGVDPQQLFNLEQMARANEAEATRLLNLDMAPFVGDDGGIKELRDQMKAWLVQNQIRSDPGVKDCISRALEKKRRSDP